MSGPVRTLHIDIEGGMGGSSRSLLELLSRLDRNRISPLVVHRIDGPIVKRYAEIEIPTAHVPEIASYAPRDEKSFKNLLASLPRLMHINKAVDHIVDLAHDHDVHLGSEVVNGLFVEGDRLFRRT